MNELFKGKKKLSVEEGNPSSGGSVQVVSGGGQGPLRNIGSNIWKYVLYITLILLLIAGALFSYYYLTSPAGARTLLRAREVVVYPITKYQDLLTRAELVGKGAPGADVNVSRRGLIFKDFKAIGSREIIQGSTLLFAYDLDVVNENFPSMPLDVDCWIMYQNKKIQGQIIPANPMVSGRFVREIRCQFIGEQTKDLLGSNTVRGTVSYPYWTKDVTLDVYFTSESTYNNLLRTGEDFFRYFGIRDRSPKIVYQGEPIEVQIGVSTDNRQPVVLFEDFNPVVKIFLINQGGGKMEKLTNLILKIPRELTINREYSPHPSLFCPFSQNYRTEGEYNVYTLDPLYRDHFEVDRAGHVDFECFLDVGQGFMADELYVRKNYIVEAYYTYQLMERSEHITVKKVEEARPDVESTVVADEGVVTL